MHHGGKVEWTLQNVDGARFPVLGNARVTEGRLNTGGGNG